MAISLLTLNVVLASMQDAWDGRQAYYPCEENSTSNNLLDEGTYKYNLSYYGDVNYSIYKVGSGACEIRTTQYPNDNTVDFINYTYTLDLWLRWDESQGTWNIPISFYRADTGQMRGYLSLHENSNYCAGNWFSSNNFCPDGTGKNLTVRNWIHIVVTQNQSHDFFYLNGVLDEAPRPRSVDNHRAMSNKIRFGAGDSPSNGFAGVIDNVLLTSYNYTAQDVIDSYNNYAGYDFLNISSPPTPNVTLGISMYFENSTHITTKIDTYDFYKTYINLTYSNGTIEDNYNCRISGLPYNEIISLNFNITNNLYESNWDYVNLSGNYTLNAYCEEQPHPNAIIFQDNFENVSHGTDYYELSGTPQFNWRNVPAGDYINGTDVRSYSGDRSLNVSDLGTGEFLIERLNGSDEIYESISFVGQAYFVSGQSFQFDFTPARVHFTSRFNDSGYWIYTGSRWKPNVSISNYQLNMDNWVKFEFRQEIGNTSNYLMYINNTYWGTLSDYPADAVPSFQFGTNEMQIDNFTVYNLSHYPFESIAYNDDLEVINTPIIIEIQGFEYYSGNPKINYNITELYDLLSSISWKGDNINYANCTYYLQDAGTVVFPNQIINETTCDSISCNYTYDDPYSYNFSIYNLENLDNHVLQIDACYEGIPQDLDIWICGNKTTIPSGSFPSCIGNGTYIIEQTNCLDYNSVEVNISSNGTFSNRVLIKEIEFNLQFGLHIDRWSSTVFYNSTTEKYYINHPHTYFTSGIKPNTINCNFPNIYDTFTKSINISYGDIIPVIELLYINNSNGLFAIDDNITIYEYYAGNWQFIYSIIDNNIVTISSHINNESEILDSDSGMTPYPYIVNGFTFVDFDSNPYTWNVSVLDGDGNYVSQTFSFNLTDVTLPFCNGLSDASVTNETYYNWSVFCQDENFYSFNISCNNGYSYAEDGLNQVTYNFINSTLITGDTVCNYLYCDGHTKQELSKDFKSFRDEDLKEIRVQINEKVNKFKMISSERVNLDLIKKKDRISFKYSLKDKRKGNKELKFIYETSTKAVLLEDERYINWIVDPDSKTWFDSNLVDDDSAIQTIEEIDVGVWEITINTEKDSVEFESIGELNCVGGSQLILSVAEVPTSGYGSKVSNFTLSEMIMVLIIFSVIMFMMFVGLWKKVPALVMLSAVIFLFIGLFIQWVELPKWLGIVGIGLIFWSAIMMVTSFGLARS